MSDAALSNLLGALGLGLNDLLQAGVERAAGHGGQAAAALVVIGAEPGLGPGRLADAVGLSQPGAVRLVDRLVAEGLASRDSGKDGRSVALRLTPAGRERRAEVLAARAAVLCPLLEALSGAERQALEGVARKLLAAMTTSERRADALCRLCDEPVCQAAGCPVDAACHGLPA